MACQTEWELNGIGQGPFGSSLIPDQSEISEWEMMQEVSPVPVTHTAPTVAITLSSYFLLPNETALVTFFFSEEPTGFTVSDVTAPHGSLSLFSVTGDPQIYTAVFTPDVDVDAPVNAITVGTGWSNSIGLHPLSITGSLNLQIFTVSQLVSRLGNRLMVNGADFRFSGANIYWLGADFDEPTGWASTNAHVVQPSHFRVDDALTTAQTLGAKVVRSISLGWNVGHPGSLLPVLGGPYNETAFLAMDYAIYKAGQLGLYLIIPLCDEYDYYWGNKNFFGADFWTNPVTIAAYRAYVSQILNRVNTFTGQAYKDDLTIMAWQTGNEISATYAQQDALAAYIKTIDLKHLVMDGVAANHTPSQDRLVNSPHIDIVGCHYWPMSVIQLAADMSAPNLSNKVVIADEWDWGESYGAFDLATFIAALEASAPVRGDLWWELAGRADTYGWAYSTNLYTGVGVPLNVPLSMMFDAANMEAKATILRNHAYAVRGIVVPSYPALSAPVLAVNGQTLSWRGVSGGKTYTIERSTISAIAGFASVVDLLTDGYTTTRTGVTNPGGTWVDPNPIPGATIWYRIYGLNASDVAGPVSNVVSINYSASIISDTFTDADNTALTDHVIAPQNIPAASWINLNGTCKISSNQATWNVLDGGFISRSAVDSGESDVTITAIMVYRNNAAVAQSIIGRATDGANCWVFTLYAGSAYLSEVNSGVQTDRVVEVADLVDGTTYPVIITMNGTTISFVVNGHTLTYTSANFQANTKHGIGFYSTVLHGVEAVDDFVISVV